MSQIYSAISLTNNQGLVKGEKYFLENPINDMVDVYDTNSMYVATLQINNFNSLVQLF